MPCARNFLGNRPLLINRFNGWAYRIDTVRIGLREGVCVIDGSRVGIGSTPINSLNGAHGETIQRMALGANAICQTKARAQGIVGPVTITWANAMHGEVTSKMAAALTTSPAFKLLLPLFQENGGILGVVSEPLPHLAQSLVEKCLKEVRDHV